MQNSETVSDYERLQTAVEAAGVGTWDFNPITGELQWSNRCKELFGLPPTAEVDYPRFLEGLHPDDREPTDKVVQQALDPKGTGSYDVEYRTVGLEDGELRWVRATGRAFFDAARSQAVRFIGTITDITASRQTENNYRFLAENAPLLLLVTNAAGEPTYANNSLLKFTGYTLAQLQESWAGIVHPDDLAMLAERWQRAIDHGIPYQAEYRLRRHDGEYFWYLNNTQPQLDADGQVVQWVNTSTDIDARHRAEQQLGQQQEEMRWVTELMPQMVWVTDPQGYHTYFNQRWIEFTGYNVEQSQGTEMWNNLLHPDDQQRARTVWTHSLTTGAPYEIEYRFKSKEGDYRWFLARALPMRDEQGQITKWFGTCTDINEQKLASERLRWSEERYAMASLATNDAIWDWNLETNALTWNNAIERVFQYQPGEVQETSEWWYNHIHPEDAERIVHGIHEVIDGGGKLWKDSYRYRRADGTYAEVIDRGHIAHNEAGKPVRMIGAMQDVSEQRRAAAELRRREEEFSTLADNVAQLAWMAEANGDIYWYNKRWYEFTGTTLEEMRGWGWEKVHHPDHIERVVAFVRQAWGAGKAWELSFPLRSHEGEYRWFLTRAVPVHNEQGEVVRWLGTNTDVTDMRQMQERLERAYNDLELKITFRTLELEREVQSLKQQLGQA
ncbi:PAS domain-containing protein [Hymenobacter latericus]|uniref:PAS domain-containing protein n=1 Tax=Hymenobacter sp. YIM 151858-1 TaxID=2987688 RepID=UPI002226BE9F|nr:PAS domain-containing protein [Hymenobacter sp. YIM 151858-1]UYZ57352.1 PAS domain-containing protein [Hymenobacter sp. YIM 151858-1]